MNTVNAAALTPCLDRDAAVSWIAREGEIDDIVTLDNACAIVLALHHVRQTMPSCEVRKLHTVVNLPQSAVLRAMRHLDHAGIVTVSENHHDPLGAFISLPDSVTSKIEALDLAA